MVATIALILAYQSLHGTVYQAIGALTASFMFGFAAGGALAGALLSRGFAPARTALAADAGGLACALASALVLWTGAAGANLAGKLLLALLLAGAGLSCGVELPALAGWLGRPAEDLDPAARTARGAGLVDASDHAGAFVGAIVAGTLLVPALGVLGALVGVATLRLASLAPLGAACLRGLFRGRAGPRSGRERPARAG
jgi:MFS family permease